MKSRRVSVIEARYWASYPWFSKATLSTASQAICDSLIYSVQEGVQFSRSAYVCAMAF